MSTALRFRHDDAAFSHALRTRVAAYLRTRPRGALDDGTLLRRALLLCVTFVGLQALILSDRFHGLDLLLLQIGVGLTAFEIALNIAHDGSHGAWSRRPWVNRALMYTFDLVGIDSYIWTFNHLLSHHANPNVPAMDAAIDSAGPVKLHPRVASAPGQAHQHRYIFVVYALSTLYKMFVYDVYSYARGRIGAHETGRHPWYRWAWLFVSRALVVGYMVGLPLHFVSVPAWQILAGFVAMHLVAGIAIGFIFQVTHLSDRTRFPEPDAEGRLDASFARHVLETTSDFAVDRPVVTAISGGLNLHVAHHLFPHVNQVHLPALTRIVRDTAAEYGMPYHAHASTHGAVRSHLRLLSRLGAPG